jgi:SAM-dependent methyltransferase
MKMIRDAYSSANAIIDYCDFRLCALNVLGVASWKRAQAIDPLRLYAGRLSRGEPQFRTHYGLTPFTPSTRNIFHDLKTTFPLTDGMVDVFQAQDVFEHLGYDVIPAIFDEIFRILKPGGLFRLSVPDYRCDIYRNRSIKGANGEIIFDPVGGGFYKDGKIEGGGHLWFPVFESVKALFDRSSFVVHGNVDFRHYTAPDGSFVLKPIDYSLGHVRRTPDNDARVTHNSRPLSIVVDAYKAAPKTHNERHA